jgi:cation diffusion facilitator CzcD-associated flavoprotein CzcO
VTTTRTAVAIIGSGFAGLGAGIRLKAAGIHDFVILEGANEVGGTWRDNTYPGAACDIPSHLYSFSFEPNPDWTTAYSPQEEIQAYLVHCADRYGLRDHLFFRAWVTDARWDDDDRTWTLTTRDGRSFVADAIVGAIGGLRDPDYPDVSGRERFQGDQMHSARWDHDVDLDGKRVAVVGTGASAIQIVPAIADTAQQVTVLQRSPAWVMRRHQHTYPDLVRSLFRKVPLAQKLHRTQLYWQTEARYLAFGPLHQVIMPVGERIVKRLIDRDIDDPALRDRVTPDYRMGCKRILIADDYYRALDRPDVDVIDQHVAEVTPTGIITADGQQVDVDVIVWCTGFQIRSPLGQLHVTGREGRSLQEAWDDRPIAYLGMTMPDFPNAFLMMGPNSGLGHNSVIFMIESQLNYLIPALQQIVNGDVAELDLKPSALERFRDEVDRRTARAVWASGCASWYLDEDGTNYTLWPGSTVEYRIRTARFDRHRYRVVRRSDVPAPAPQQVPTDA